jgi:alanine racemase
MNLLLRNIIPVIKAEFIGKSDVAIIDSVSIDSRSMQNFSGTLFFAIVGSNNDGHNYIVELIKQGVSYFVVEHIPENLQNQANFLVVPNSLKALQQLASYYRQLFEIPIIGITGSNGKTIIKEWLNFLLNPNFNVIKSPKSYNSQVGVPLSVLGINEKHNLGIFEAGISTTNEMQNLEDIIKPTIGILTNIGSAHDEGFEDVGQKIKEKLLLFSHVGILILNKNKTVEVFLPNTIPTFTWSSSDKNADVFVIAKEKNSKTHLKVTYQETCFEIIIPFQDQASIENAIQCLMVLLYFNYSSERIQEKMALLYPVEMRLKVKTGINNTVLIDDSYSSDYQSLKIALDFLENQTQHRKKTIIISDIFQSGLSDEELYSRVSQLIIFNKIQRVITIGETIFKYQKRFLNCYAFKNTSEFLNSLESINFENETILIKGARSYNFEEIVKILEQKNHETVLEINLNAISHNLNYFKAKLLPKTKMMVMVKAFGYGNGGFEIANLLQHHNVEYLGVAFADEGISLKNAGITIPIMVLNPEITSFSSIINFELEPEIYSLRGLNAFLKIAKQKKISAYPIHIKLDTGMHRLGFQSENLSELIGILKETTLVKVTSILSHLATSDDANSSEFVLHQIKLFEELSQKVMQELQTQPIRHILNTSGISNYTQAQYEMVRLGIGLYGISNDPDEQKYLQMVGTLKSIISQIRNIKKGESVGYSRNFIANRDSRIATIPIGYADGISRKLGNKNGYVIIGKQKASIVGNVCMDMLMVDVTDAECFEGSEVILFGEKPSVPELANIVGTISYEILVGISQRVKRIFFRD